MEQVTIENDVLAIKVALLGAEVQEVKSLKDNFSYIWYADAKYWGRRAPVLFPFIGRSYENKYLIDGKEYNMKQHGFLRDQVFKIVDKQKNKLVLQHSATEETKLVYPYSYTVTITYTLEDTYLHINYEIDNNDAKDMYYSFGFHPGFNLNSDLSNYSLQFEPKLNSLPTLLVEPNPFRNGKIADTQLQNGKLELNYPMLDNGVKIYDISDIKTVSLISCVDAHQVTEDIADFPYLAVWSPENKKAPFLCVEPFRGLPDQYGKTMDIQDKLGEQHIAANSNDQFTVSLNFK